MKVSKYTVVTEQDGMKYLYHQISGALLKVDFELADAIEHSLLTAIPQELQSVLAKSAFLVEDDVVEYECIQRTNKRYRNSPILRVTIMPTLNCNFNCWYCYEEHYPSKMTESGRDSVIKFIKREIEEKELKGLHLDWFGGEPLLYFRPIIYPTSIDLKGWCEEKGITFHNSITTNGSLITNQMVRRMNEIKMNNFQITLDGGKEAHNKIRFSVKMLDSYSRIVNNIHLLVRGIEDISIDLRLNYTTENVDTLDSVLESFDYDVRKSIKVSPHIVWQYSDSLDILSDKIHTLENTSIERGYRILNQIRKARCTSCYVENNNQYVVNHNLDVYKCTAREFDASHCVGHIETDGHFKPNALFQKYLDTPSPFNNKICLDCEYLPSCLDAPSCIQKSIEGQPFSCMKGEIKKDIHNFIRRSVLGKAQHVLYTLLFFLFSSFLFAQPTPLSFHGNVKDAKGTPIVGAVVVLKNATDSTYTKGITTNEEGVFRFENIQSQDYLFSISCLGYKPYQQRISLTTASSDQTYTLEEKTEEINEVKIAAYFSQHKVTGETVVTVKGNPLAAGKSSLDFLRYVHGVTVTRGEIHIAGKDATTIMLDNRKISSRELEAIPTEMIQTLTVIPNPGAEYGIKDNGVLIVKLRDTKGLIGSASATGQADVNGFVEAQLSNTLQYQYDKLRIYNNLLGGYGIYRTHNRIKMHSDTYDYESNEHKKNNDYGVYENLAFHYQLNKSHGVSFYTGGMFNQSALNQKNKHEALLTSEQKFDKKAYNVTTGLFYEYKLPRLEEGALSLKAEYVHQTEKSKNSFVFGTDDSSNSTLSMDYLTVEPKVDIKLKKRTRGVKSGFTYNLLRDANTFTGFSLLSLGGLKQQDFLNNGMDLIPWFEYFEMIGSSFFVQVGLSYHYTHVNFTDLLYNFENYSVDHKGLHPNIKMQYLIYAPTQTVIEAQYRRDYSLPNYGYYNPVAQYQTENFYSIGNRRLNQEIIHSGTLTLYVFPNLSIAYDLNYLSDIIHKVTELDPVRPNTYYTIPKNLGSRLRHQVRLDMEIGYGLWYSKLVLYDQFWTERAAERKLSSNSFGWYWSHNFRITNNISFTTLFEGYTAYKRLSHERGTMYSLDAGLNFSLFNKQLALNLLGANIIQDEQYRRIIHPNMEIEHWNKYPSWRIKLDLRWYFSAGGKITRLKMPQVTVPERKSPAF